MTQARAAMLWFLALAVGLNPLFFTLYRLAVFNTVPHDDYTGFLLWLEGAGRFPDSPYCYRLLSMAAAWPLYRLMPLIQLTNVPEAMTPALLKANAALSLLSYLSSIVMAQLLYRLARTEAGLDRGAAMAAGALGWALLWYTQVNSIDALALMLITLGLCLLRHRLAFAALMLVCVGVNEKIGLVLAIWLVIRCTLSASDRRQFLWQAAAALGSVAAYLALVAVLALPGNEYQLQPSGYLATVAENIAAHASARGVFLNVLPIAVLAGVALLRRESGMFTRADILVIPALMGVALVLTHLFQAGRIVMHAAPIFVVPAVAGLMSRGAATQMSARACCETDASPARPGSPRTAPPHHDPWPPAA